MDRGLGWAGLGGDALAFVLSRIATGGRWLVVVDEPDAAELLVRGLRFFHPTPEMLAVLPADDVRPYDGFSPDPGVVRERLHTLDRIEGGGDLLVVAPCAAICQRVARTRPTLTVTVGHTLDRDDLVHWLTGTGYLATSQVAGPGCFAVRGDVVDVWPVASDDPVRVDFFDDEIEEIRPFDPQTRRTTGKRPEIRLIPAREERLDDDALHRLHGELARHVTAQGRGSVLRRRVMEELRSGIRFSAVEDWLPAVVDVVDPLDVIGDMKTIVVHPDEVAASMREFDRSARTRWEALDDDDRPLVPPAERYVPAAAVLARLADAHPVTELAMEGRSVDLGARNVEGLAVRGTDLAPALRHLAKLADDGARVALVVQNRRRAEALVGLLEPHGVFPQPCASVDDVPPSEISLLTGDLPRGFAAAGSGWVLLPATSLFGSRRRAQRMDRIHAFFDAAVTSISQLKDGDFVVHRLHGIGLYRGLHRVAVQGIGDFRARASKAAQDYVRLEYRGGDLLYLPATELGQLSRYVPARGQAKVKLDKLGGETWARRKGKVRDSILQMAQDLLRTQARRELASREAHPAKGPLYRAFEARFPYEETPDQGAAIDAVQDDLSGDSPMDRLVCGDVGFGKTEVAMRAAMRVVEGGKQVAVLCPTTVLAFQHGKTFADRFDGFPVRVEMLSRFRSTAEIKGVLAGLRSGAVDIVVGTTRLLGRDVRFADLGLFVVDEEHRFGVKQKERLKSLRAQVDVLSMSATPIPRTLQMGLSGIRDMSLMATPPRDRLAVRTTVARMTRARVTDTIRQELERGGQVFFVHNRVETIEPLAERLREWAPEARFAVAHGKMDATELEDILVRFIRRETDVLVCTAIMESGVDLPNVNTMLVNRADMFGLAQLYQLRGRVGRSSVRASCTLLVPETLTKDARRRLQVLVDNTRLGSGFSIAAADLELRGAGNLVGAKQSGNIDAVGYEVWLSMLAEAVDHARGHLDRERIDPEIHVPVDAFLPENLIPEVPERLGWYQRLSDAPSVGAVDRIVEALEDMTGELPMPVQNLAGLAHTRVYCREFGIVRLVWKKVRVSMDLHSHHAIDARSLERFAERHPKRAELRSGNDGIHLEVRFTPAEGEHPFRFLRWVFVQLKQ